MFSSQKHPSDSSFLSLSLLEKWCTDSQQILHGRDRLSSHAFLQENHPFVRSGFICLSAARSSGTCRLLPLLQLAQYLLGKTAQCCTSHPPFCAPWKAKELRSTGIFSVSRHKIGLHPSSEKGTVIRRKYPV